MNASELLIK